MNILIACEESQRVCAAFRERGHEAYSCDIVECSGGHPEWHIMQDVLPLINGRCKFTTMDGAEHIIDDRWDMLIAFPPCTHLAVSGARYFAQKRQDGRQQQAIDFFMRFVDADCSKVAIENPVGIMSTHFRKPDQIIQPFMFGDAFEKRTCLWLKGIKPLVPTNLVEPPKRTVYASGRTMPSWYADAWRLPPGERAKVRSTTFTGIANAMAEQWGWCV